MVVLLLPHLIFSMQYSLVGLLCKLAIVIAIGTLIAKWFKDMLSERFPFLKPSTPVRKFGNSEVESCGKAIGETYKEGLGTNNYKVLCGSVV
jgi:hypothetical protein